MTKQEFIGKWITGDFARSPRYPEVIEAFIRKLNELMQSKPLEWVEEPYTWLAKTPFYTYAIHETFYTRQFALKIPYSQLDHVFKTLEEAKAAAEKDCRERFNQMLQ